MPFNMDSAALAGIIHNGGHGSCLGDRNHRVRPFVPNGAGSMGAA
ncbi:MAG: hypothetical protein OJF50_004444 [Nitrospira sp.]|nr:hypothetical protein [Nitrospira sp.]